MAQRSKERKLKNLPDNDHEFWNEANIELTNISKKEPCEHYFEKESRSSIKCRKCGMGLYINHSDIIDAGHLYNKGQLVI